MIGKLAFCLLFGAIGARYTPLEDEVILENPQVTNWGDWARSMETCSAGLLVTGFQLKMEEKVDNQDNTAINGIRFMCGAPFRPGFVNMQQITSNYGRYGKAIEREFCDDFGYAIGFQMKSQKYQGRGDDVAAANMKLICFDGTELEGYDEQGDFFPESEYTEMQMCPEKMALCGLQTQVESPQWWGKFFSKMITVRL